MTRAVNSQQTYETNPDLKPRISLELLPFEAALIDLDGAITAANSAWVAGRPAVKESHAEWCDRLHSSAPELRSTLLSGIDSVLTRREPSFTQEYEAGNGRWRITIRWAPDGALALRQRVTSSEDACDDEREWQARKMESVGRLVSGVAHDFANLLTLIGGYCDILMRRLNEEDPLRPELEEIGKAANRGSALTGQLLGFSRGQASQPRPLDLNAVIIDMQRMLRPIIGEYIDLRTNLSPELGKVVADRGQMEQVIMNLILNARDAMPSGGLIRIDTFESELDAETAQARGMRPGASVMMTIVDTGHGIEYGALEHIFEPFFTTKEEGKGTGLGLSTVQSIVSRSGGCISVRSAPREGAAFTVCLPRASNTAEDESAGPARTPEAANQSETVLLVEDEESVRRLIAYVLSSRGYRVLEAANAHEALKIFSERGSEIQLVLTDMVMPNMSGRELADRLRQASPDLPIVFMSGYTDDVLIRTGALGPGMSFLKKPLRPDTITAKIREALDASSLPFTR